MADPLIGQILDDRYEIVRLLGAGGMGAVYEARQISMDRQVALKVLHPEFAARSDAEKRFEREMKATSRIVHPNTVQVFDYGKSDDRLYLAMEYVEGRTLKDAVQAEGPFSAERAIHIATQVAKALGAAHAEGIVHRDLKPDNIMLTERYGERDVVKVVDFGIARFVGDERSALTADGALIGTPAYLSPEQATGGKADHRSDLYSLGLIIFFMVTRSQPYTGETPVSILLKHVQEPLQPIVAAGGDGPPELQTLIDNLVEKDPELRPQAAQVVAARLTSFGTSGGSFAPTDIHDVVAAPAPEPTTSSPMKWLWIALAVILVASTAGAVWMMLKSDGEPSAEETADSETADSETADSETTASPSVTESLAQAKIKHDAKKSAATAKAVTERAEPNRTVRPTEAKPNRTRRRLLQAEPANYWEHELAAALAADGLPPTPEACRETRPAMGSKLASIAGQLVGCKPDDSVKILYSLDFEPKSGARSGEHLVLIARVHQCAGSESNITREAAEKALVACPTSAVALNLRGNALQRARDLKAAARDYARATDLAETFAAPRFNLGLIMLRNGDNVGAIARFSETIGRDPKFQGAHAARGRAYLMSKNYGAAAADLAEASRREPSNGTHWLLLGHAHAGAASLEAAKKAWCRARSMGVTDAKALCPQPESPK